MSMRVLIADDDPSALNMIVALLKLLGIEDPSTAEDGVAALKLFRRNEFDLVLLDWDMPKMSGLEVLEAIRATGHETPVVMITSRAEKSDVVGALKAGATDYVVKPFDVDKLRERLERLCQPKAASVDAAVYRARSVMNDDVLTIQEDATLAEAIQVLLERGFSGLPVVNHEDCLVGVISELQLTRTICHPEIKHQPVADFMTRDLITASEDTLLSDVVFMMEEHRVRRIPVVRDGRLVGLISRRDLLRHASEHEEAIVDFLGTIRASGAV